MTTSISILDYNYCFLGVCLCSAGHVLLNNYHLKIASLVLSILSIISLSFSIKSPPQQLPNMFRIVFFFLICIAGVTFNSLFTQQNNIHTANQTDTCLMLILEAVTLLIGVTVEIVQTLLNIINIEETESLELERQLQEEEKKQEALTAVWKVSVKLEKTKEELEKHKQARSTVRSRSCLNQDPKISELESLIKQLELKLRYKRQVYSDLLDIQLIPPPYPTTELDFEDVTAVVPAK